MTCLASLAVNGAVWRCDLHSPHDGLAHRNCDAKTVWCSHDEAVQYGRKEP